MDDRLLYLGALALVFLIPGPDMLLLLQTGARHGRQAAFATALGLALARACHVALAAVGLATLFKVLPWTFEVVKLVGAAYLLWLGVRMLRPTAAEQGEQQLRSAPGHWLSAARRGVMTNLLNPKALLFCSVLLPQFIDPAQGQVTGKFALLGLALVMTGMLFDLIYATTGDWIGRRLQHHAGAQRVQQWLFGSLLIGFALRLAWVQQG